jgi:hypothetical protein
MKRIIIFLIITLTPMCSIACKKPATHAYYTVKGKLLHPMCILSLLGGNGFLADSHMLHRINISKCQHRYTEIRPAPSSSGKHSLIPYWVTYNFPESDLSHTNQESSSSFSYQYIGTTDNHVIVFKTLYSGGGSGVFDAILLVYPIYKKHLSFRSIRLIDGGDRFSGGIKTVCITHNTLAIVRYNPKNSANTQSYPDVRDQYNVPDPYEKLMQIS